MKFVVVILGPACAGKGVQSRKLSEYINYSHLSAGEILRTTYAVGTPERTALDNGNLIDIQVLNQIMHQEMIKHNYKVVLDGYPRVIDQAKFVADLNVVKLVFVINVDVATLAARTLHRTICHICNKTFAGPSECCGEQTSKRNDDTLEILEKRLDIYNNDLQKVLNILQGPCFFIDGNQTEDAVFKCIIEIYHKYNNV